MLRQAYMDYAFLRRIYEAMLFPRLIEEKMLLLLRQGKLAKWFSGIGQEAVSVGATLAMNTDEYILPLHRNLGVFTSRGVSLTRLIGQFLGKEGGFTRGRDRSFHFGSVEHRIMGMISHLGPQLAVADGIALAEKLSRTERATLVFCGEGASSEGDFHEALNLAAVWDLPVIFLIENNGYALSTPVEEQYRCRRLADRGAGYGMESVRIDGNDVLAVYDTIRGVREYCIREQKPYLVECITFRMRGHEEASGIDYVPPELLEMWSRKDPLMRLEEFLRNEGLLDEPEMSALRKSLVTGIQEAVREALEQAEPGPDPEKELGAVYRKAEVAAAPADKHGQAGEAGQAGQAARAEIRYIDAISEAIRQGMERYDKLLLMGQDIGLYGGVFKVTEGFLEAFGKERVRNTPLCESAVVGAAMGASLLGYKSIVEMQFADFVSMAFNQVVNNLAKSHYRWGWAPDVVIRLPTGAGTGGGPFHSQSTEAWFLKCPGLKILYPAFPADAKGLLLSALEDPNPVLFYEHKALYRRVKEKVPQAYYTIPPGEAMLCSEGKDLSIITYGLGVHWALDWLVRHPEVSADLVDLRSLQPWDKEAVAKSVKKTGKALILHEDTLSMGFGAEISAWLAEHCFEQLDAPVLRCASLDTPVPANVSLEALFLADSRLGESLERLLRY